MMEFADITIDLVIQKSLKTVWLMHSQCHVSVMSQRWGRRESHPKRFHSSFYNSLYAEDKSEWRTKWTTAVTHLGLVLFIQKNSHASRPRQLSIQRLERTLKELQKNKTCRRIGLLQSRTSIPSGRPWPRTMPAITYQRTSRVSTLGRTSTRPTDDSDTPQDTFSSTL